MEALKVDLSYQWEPVFVDKNCGYLFPEQLSEFMRQEYKKPAIYRWNIFRYKPGDKKLIYIGEAKELCPQRINGYLNPGPTQQTNKRMKEIFQSYLNEGLKIGLEILNFEKILIDSSVFTRDNLHNKHFRRLIEELMIIISKQKGFQILNL